MICFLVFLYLLQCSLQELLSLLGLQQQTLPALVQLIKLCPKVAGLVARRGLQQLSSSTVHSLDCGTMGQHIITQNLEEPERGKKFFMGSNIIV